MAASPPPGLPADYFDGTHAQARQVSLQMVGEQLVLVDAASGQPIARHARDAIEWPERTRHGARMAHLPDGGSVHAHDPKAWDTWRAQAGHQSSWVVRSQLSWRAVTLAMALLVLTLAGAYQWGLPWATQGILAITPRSVDATVGQATLPALEEHWFQATQLPQATRDGLTQAFAHAAQQARLRSALVDEAPFQVVFRRSRMGPNALALPDGTIVITDELVTLLNDDQAVLIGVFAHEWGHVQHRHGMRMLIQASAVGALASLIVGDFSQVLAAAPVMMGQMAYSRDFEREADDVSIQVLKANGVAPSVMVTLFDQLSAYKKSRGHDDDDDGLGIALSSHPSDAERTARFANAPQAPAAAP
jgi:Zn-dependent protease with chaperone function